REECSREPPADGVRTAVPARTECRVLAVASRAAAGAPGAGPRGADHTRTRTRPWLRPGRSRRLPRAAGLLRRRGRLRFGRTRRGQDARREGRRRGRASRVRRRRLRRTVGLRRRARLGLLAPSAQTRGRSVPAPAGRLARPGRRLRARPLRAPATLALGTQGPQAHDARRGSRVLRAARATGVRRGAIRRTAPDGPDARGRLLVLPSEGLMPSSP